jgi:hypothetical protein
MVRKMWEFPKFFVFNSKAESIRNNSVFFAFYLLLFAFIQIFVFYFSRVIYYEVSDVFVSVF